MTKKIGVQLSELVILLGFILTCFGMISIFAASSLKATQLFKNEYYFLTKQLSTSIFGFLLVGAILCSPIAIFEKTVLPSLMFVIILLLCIFLPGAYNKVGGASRWLNIPFIGGQPSELSKIVLVLFLSKNLSRPSHQINNFLSGIFPNILVLSLLSGLLLVQKDLGTPVLLVMITGAMLLAAGVSLKHLGILSTGLIFTIFLAVILEPYRIRRLLSYLDPWSESHGQGFQIIQSFVAFSNGSLFGTGLGESKQKLFFLPEAHTDFIVSVIAEETGLLGLFSLLGCYVALALICFKIVEIQKIKFRQYLAFGLTIMLNFQIIFNISVAMGLLPTKGMPLPFISAGSSSLLVSLISIGILAKLARESGDQIHHRPGNQNPNA